MNAFKHPLLVQRASELEAFFKARYGRWCQSKLKDKRQSVADATLCISTYRVQRWLQLEAYAKKCGWSSKPVLPYERNFRARLEFFADLLECSAPVFQTVALGAVLDEFVLHKSRPEYLRDDMETPDSLGFERMVMRITNPCKPRSSALADLMASVIQSPAPYAKPNGGNGPGTIRSVNRENFETLLAREFYENGAGI